MEIDPVFPHIVFVAKDSIYRSTNYGASGSWVYMGMPGTGNLNEMKQGTNNRNRMYVSQGSNIFRSDNILVNPGPATWTNVSSGLPNLFITGIEVDPTNADHVYVCVSNFFAGDKVFFSSNGGAAGSWTNISGSLPNVAMLCLAFHDNGLHGLYVGSDVGVFYRDDNLGDWIYYSNSMPVVPVSDLYINSASGEIVAGTYGRGLWKSDLYAGCDATIELGGGGGIGGERHYATSNWISSTQDYDPDFGTHIRYSAGHYIDLKPGFEISGIGYFNGKIGPCPPPYAQPMMGPPIQRSKFVFTEEVLRKLDNSK
jgi:hypothetical protein